MKFKFIINEDTASEKPEDYEEPEFLWRCFDCGQTENFETVEYWTDWGSEYDCQCAVCGSLNTAEDGNGYPECPKCPNFGFYCENCCMCKCIECWKWFMASEEPEDYVCGECL